jgi:hypothetical protein
VQEQNGLAASNLAKADSEPVDVRELIGSRSEVFRRGA